MQTLSNLVLHPYILLALKTGLGLLITAITSFIVRRIIGRLGSKGQSGFGSGRGFFIALKPPASLLVWISGLYAIGQYLRMSLDLENYLHFLPEARSIGVIVALTWFLMRLLDHLKPLLLSGKHKKLDVTSANAVLRIAKLICAVLAGLLCLQVLGININTFLTVGGIGTLIIGLAAKSIIENFFGSLMLNLDRPFEVGDSIRSLDGKYEGEVEEIGWRVSRLRNAQKKAIYVTNSQFTTGALENASRLTHRLIDQTLYIRYLDIKKLPQILKGMEAVLYNCEHLDKSQYQFARLVSFGEHGIVVRVYALSKITQFMPFLALQEMILLAISNVVAEHGARFSSVHTVHVPAITPDNTD